nr:MAG TPA: hypothetical protein [Caudoviricetes sp.]
MRCTEMRNARWAIHSIICLHCAAAVVIGVLAGLSGTWMNALVVTAIVYPVTGLAVLAGIDVWEWWTNRGSTVPGTYMYRGGNGSRYED